MNENMRILVALALTMVVLIGWSLLFPQQQVVDREANETREVAEERVEDPDPERPEVEPDPAVEEPAPEEPVEEDLPREREDLLEGERITVDTPEYRAVINTQGGILEHFELKQYRETIDPDSGLVDLIGGEIMHRAPMGLLWNFQPTWEEAEWSVEDGDLSLAPGEEGSLILRGDMGDILLERELIFTGGTYRIDENLRVYNRSGTSLSSDLSFTLACPPLVKDPTRYNRNEFVTYVDGEQTKWSDEETLEPGVQSTGNVTWAGIGSSYFFLAMVPDEDEPMFAKGQYYREGEGVYRAAVESRLSLAEDQSRDIGLTYYIGPKMDQHLAAIPDKNLQEAIDYGWFDIIATPLVKVLNFFNGYTGNYGLAIILLTVVIKIIFWPLSHKSFKSMEKMKKLQPLMKEIKEKYKDDRQKMNQELMQLYKTYKVNPIGGCLPMLLQIPVFIGLFEGLMGAVELRHAPFITNVPFTDVVWLADLASRDPLYVTPILMGLSMFLQLRMSPSMGDPTQAKIMMILPVFLTFIFMTFPAGLVVYFITNNVLTIAQQWFMMRKA